ncbi:Metallo-beta-lactamase domain-containing protein 2 [Seminavis robusta]|uniref:Metallo-beta-lactamase domain-containing protein 2 n=1 Tax=Seminavis robusta TaxID=568900 RepID=A0A9N8HT41_9STRA|nr:Metallo-beta-lactamase domain-containing protein 2 [Seminavis robusta]|eukprot:Sro1818_g299590.1 Metallo-beta-lactamase domain-containing protein 2 (299) ;mRNA; f:14851-15747
MTPEDNFSVVELAPCIYMCRELHYAQKWNTANCYVVQGTKMDLIIDTGLGLWNFKEFLVQKKLISQNDKPYIAVVTHVHFDHSGGLHQFADSCAIHEEEQEAIETSDNVAACTFIYQTDIEKNPPTPDWQAADYHVRPVKPTRVLRGRESSFDLGDNRIIQVIHTPGHSAGSIVFWDEQTGILFSGDTVCDGPVLDWAPTSSVEDYLQTMDILSSLASKVKRVFPGHDNEFDGNRLKQIADDYLKGAGTCHSCTAKLTKALATMLLRGRNAKGATSCERGCYHACCCSCIFGPAMNHG